MTANDRALNMKVDHLTSLYEINYWVAAERKQYRNVVNDAEKMARQLNIRYKDLDDKEKAALLFYTVRFTNFLNFDINQLSRKIDIGHFNFDNSGFNMYCLLKAAGIDGAILLSGQRNGAKMNESMDEGDINAIAYLTGGTPYFMNLETIFDIPFAVPSQVEGETDTRMLTFGGNLRVKSNVETGPSMPVTLSGKNAHIERLKLSLAPDNKNLAVRRSTTLTGLSKLATQRDLILYEDLYESERKAFNEETSLIEKLEDRKKSKKYVDEARNAFAEARKNQKTTFLDEAKDWFGQEITDLTNYKTDTLGIRHTAPNFVYSSSFNMDGLVKKAGNNFIIEIGKIQGQPLVIKPEQRKRNIDIYSPFARSIEYNIEFEVPDGYTVEGLESLNKNVSNETGYFSAEVSAKGKMVFIKLKKHYLHHFEPAKNWDKIIEFTDAAGEWANSKILLKKS